MQLRCSYTYIKHCSGLSQFSFLWQVFSGNLQIVMSLFLSGRSLTYSTKKYLLSIQFIIRRDRHRNIYDALRIALHHNMHIDIQIIATIQSLLIPLLVCKRRTDNHSLEDQSLTCTCYVELLINAIRSSKRQYSMHFLVWCLRHLAQDCLVICHSQQPLLFQPQSTVATSTTNYTQILSSQQ